MALAMTTLGDRFIDIITQDTDADESPVNDITGKAGSVYYVKVVNAGSNSSVYFKLYDSTSATHATTHPIYVKKVGPSSTVYCVIPDGMAFTNGLSYCVTDGPGTGSLSDNGPATNDVTVRLVIS